MELSGLQIVAVPNWPKVEDGKYEDRVPGHPLVQWLARVVARVGVRLDPDLVVLRPRFLDEEPMIDRRRGVIYCSPAQYDFLRRQFPTPSFALG